MDHLGTKFSIKTFLTPDNDVCQEIHVQDVTTRSIARLGAEYMDIKIREALINLGWTPPA